MAVGKVCNNCGTVKPHSKFRHGTNICNQCANQRTKNSRRRLRLRKQSEACGFEVMYCKCYRVMIPKSNTVLLCESCVSGRGAKKRAQETGIELDTGLILKRIENYRGEFIVCCLACRGHFVGHEFSWPNGKCLSCAGQGPGHIPTPDELEAAKAAIKIERQLAEMDEVVEYDEA